MSWSFTDNCNGCELAPKCTDSKVLPKVIIGAIQAIHALSVWVDGIFHKNGHEGTGMIVMTCNNRKVTPPAEPAKD